MDFKKFGIYITKLREESGFKSQRQLALAAGIAPATLSRIEGGIQEATPSTLEKLSKHLKYISYEDLMKAAGYLNENKDTSENQYNPLDEINKLIKDFGIEQFGFFDIEQWKNFTPEDVEELKRHFEWVAHKAKERNEEK